MKKCRNVGMQECIVGVFGPGDELGEGRSLWMRTGGDRFGSIVQCRIYDRQRGLEFPCGEPAKVLNRN